MGLKSGSKSGKGVKQGVTKLSLAKSAPHSASKQTDSEDESDLDTSVMRPSIEISVSTVPQLVRAYQAGTEELKTILAKECDIIYECRVCKNLFRSLANMMAHKRVYCKTNYSYSKHALNRNHAVEDYTLLIQPEPVPSNSQENWTTSDQVPDCSNINDNTKPQIIATTSRISSLTNAKRGLREIVDRLAGNSYSNSEGSKDGKLSSTTNMYDNVNAHISTRKADHTEHSIQLEDIETSKVGKFQTKLVAAIGAEKDDLMKAQVSELQYMTSQNEALLGPDGKTVTLNRYSPLLVQKGSYGKISETSLEANECRTTKDEHVCPDCNVKFSTRKTLNHHMKSLHVTFRLCYPCPCCKSTFVNPWSVYRHLYKVHRKTAAQVRRMRPQIQQKAFKKEISLHTEIPAPETSSKNEALKELQRLDQENQAWMDNFEDDLELQRCGGCGRRFERRAALNSHSQICQKRIAARNNIKASRNISSQDKALKISQTDHNLALETNKKPNTTYKSIDSVNIVLNSLGTSRAHQGGGWVEQPKKEIPEKKIEIQIRKDYCKMSSASSVVALSNDTQSEPDSRPPSRIVDDDCFEGDVRDWDSMIEMEEVNKEESESEYPLFSDAQDTKPSYTIGNDKDGATNKLHSNSPVNDSESSVELNSLTDNSDGIYNTRDHKKDSLCLYEKSATIHKRRLSEEGTNLSKKINQESYKRRRKSLENKTSNPNENEKKSVSTTHKKLIYPVMEARMNKFINLRRLQCIPCQKKFMKFNNLRRHVAAHIGWCRYKCTLCPFKCFTKYECVDHVCKIHLKCSQHSKAAAMVESIQEQESEADVDCVPLESVNDDSDIVSYVEEAPCSSSLSMEINSLNIEDIKNIVGVSNYPYDMNNFEMSCQTHDADLNKSHTLQNSTNNETSVEDEKEVNIIKDCDKQIHRGEYKTEILNNKEIEKDSEDLSVPNITEEERQEKIVYNETENVCNDLLKTEQIHSLEQEEEIIKVDKETENVCNDLLKMEQIHSVEQEEEIIAVDKETPKHESQTENTTDCMTNCAETQIKDYKSENMRFMDTITEKQELEAISSDESSSKSSLSSDEKETNPVSQYLIYDEQGSDMSDNATDDVSKIFKEVKNANDKKCRSPESYKQSQASNKESFHEMVSKESKKLNESDLCTIGLNIENRLDNNSAIVNDKLKTVVSKSEEEEEEVKSSSGSFVSPSSSPKPKEDENALRKMVMEVIFGSGGSSDPRPDPNQNLISISMNGQTYEEESSNDRLTGVSSSSDSDVISLNNHVSSTSKAIKQIVEIERRERPVRNRIKVEKEDFIYDFTDSFLKKEESSKASLNVGGNSGRKKQCDTGKEHFKCDSTSARNSGFYKGVPKLTLVRTDPNDTLGSKRVSGPIKGSWSSVCASTSDCAGNKTYLESNSQVCSVPRKLPRTYTVKQ